MTCWCRWWSRFRSVSHAPWRRRFAPIVLGAVLAFGATSGLTPTTALAQNEPPPAGAEGEESKGRTLDGYIAWGCLAGLALFVIAKSARRS